MDINNPNTIEKVKILMLKGEKGDTGASGAGAYDDTEIRQLISDEATARQQADATLLAGLGLKVRLVTQSVTVTNIAPNASFAFAFRPTLQENEYLIGLAGFPVVHEGIFELYSVSTADDIAGKGFNFNCKNTGGQLISSVQRTFKGYAISLEGV